MVTLKAYSELLEVLYSAPLEQEQWQRFLTLLSQHTQSTFAAFLCADSRFGLSVRSHSGPEIAAESVMAYNERYAGSDPFRAPALSDPRPRIVDGDELLPNEGLLRTEMFRDVILPLGGRFATIVLLTVNVRRLEAISIWRTPERGPMDEESLRLLHLLFPHIQKALEIRQALGIAQERAAGAEAIADSSPTATFLLSRHGEVLHRNAAADALLEGSAALAIEDGVLVATQASYQEPLRRLYEDAALVSSSRAAHALALPRGAGGDGAGGQALQLLLAPLPPRQRSRTDADLILLVTDPERPVHFPDGVLRSLYGLTAAQTEVANGILTGYTLTEIAALRHVSVGTVRQQMKNILTKTGTSRQSDLVRLLMALSQSAGR
jgi:DNA-binding CsgD family transcriptional regulator